MSRLYSLVESPPAGFIYVTTYNRRQFRSHPFALLAPSLEAAKSFLCAESGPLTGVVVVLVDLATEFVKMTDSLYQLRLNSGAAGCLKEIVEPLLVLSELQSRDRDQIRASQFEFERALQNQRRMSDEFESVRVSLLRELVERRQSAERLKESERKIRGLLDSTFALVSLLTPDGTLLDANLTALSFAGISLEAVQGRPFWMAPWWSHSDAAQRQLREAIVRGAQGEVSRFETNHLDASGALHFIDFVLKPILDEAGRVEFLIPEGWDITERKRAEEEREHLQNRLMQTQKLESIGRLAGGVAHDFNNMLAVIIGRVELMTSELPEDSSIREDLVEIRLVAERSAQLTRQLLAFARRQTIKPIAVNLGDIVSGMLTMLVRLVGEDIKILWFPEASPWTVKVDPSQLDQLVTNLVVNARDAIRGVGTITLSTMNVSVSSGKSDSWGKVQAGDYAALSVKDTGEGILPELRERIFEPFFTTKGVGRGTGLGLATVLGIVEQHQGFIDVKSEPGRGTEFVVYFPRIESDAIGCSQEEGALAPRGHGETLLVVEDERAVLAIVEKTLSGLGYRVLTANGPVEAIALLSKTPIQLDLLIADVVMPEMNGRELAERLAEKQPGLRRLYMSGYSADVFSSRGVIDDGAHFIQKPFTVVQIAHRVREALSSR